MYLMNLEFIVYILYIVYYKNIKKKIKTAKCSNVFYTHTLIVLLKSIMEYNMLFIKHTKFRTWNMYVYI